MPLRAAIRRGLVGALGAVLAYDAVWAAARGLAPAHWLDLRWAPWPLGAALLAATGACLVSACARPRSTLARAQALALAAVALHAARDAALALEVAGPGSFSACLAAVSALALVDVLARPQAATHREGRASSVALVASALVTVVGLGLAQIAGSARADYTRPADAVVVLGARAYADGSPSLALYDRVRTGARLVRQGLARELVLSGGPGDGDTHETDVMRRIAEGEGVPAEAIVLDRDGLSTRHTAANVRARLAARRDASPDARRDAPGAAPRVLVVSHGYHLARIRLAFEAEGLTAFTVPARETRPLVGLPYYVAREVAGFWAYYLGARR